MELEKMQHCLAHPNVLLGSRLEQRAMMCLACIEVKLAKQAELEVENHDLKVKADQADRRAIEAEQQVARVKAFLRAETEGVKSASEGMPESQNPYKEGDELCVMWLNGWQSVQTRRAAGQAMAVVTWAIENLSHVNELAAGYGNAEISGKVSTITDKLRQFVTTE